jgi:hypothetical protein
LRQAANRAAIAATLASLAGAGSASPAGAATAPLAHGQLLHLAPVHAAVNATQSQNWFGYDQGSFEQGGKLFNSISGQWTVPAAALHSAGQAGSSSDWIGIGGGCVDSGCALTDQTLIQTGTEQDVGSDGKASYSAWWEAIPLPSTTISSVPVGPGDRMYASISEAVPNSNVWTITLKDLTRNESFTTTIPYTSTHSTAEWIEESPLVIGTSAAGFAPLPNLTSPAFDLGTANGAPVKLTGSEAMDLVDSGGNVIGTPSAPDGEGDGFNACAWATTCPLLTQAPAAVPSQHATAQPQRKRSTSKHHRKRHSRRHHHHALKHKRHHKLKPKRKGGSR